MADQTTRLEAATVKAENGSNILYRFSNDAESAALIPTESGDIQNLKMLIAEITDGASVATQIFPTTAAGLAATSSNQYFLVVSADPNLVYKLYQNQSGAAVDTGKYALTGAQMSTIQSAAQASADAAAASAVIAQQNGEDFRDYTNPAKGSHLVGHVRATLSDGIKTVGQFLDSQTVSPWEKRFADLITSKPSADPSTWDWEPAINGAIAYAAANGFRRVKLPAGDFCINNPISLRDKIVLQGEGLAVTRIRPLSDITAILAWVDDNGAAISRAGVMDLMIYPANNDAQTYTNGHGIHAKTSTTISGKVWKLQVVNVQVYRIGGTALYMEGTSLSSVAETYIQNFEANGCGDNGIWENAYAFDTYLGQAYIEACKNFGARLQGGSATYLHLHAVGCGQNDGAGNLVGGGIALKGAYYDMINCHADRNLGHGFIVGGFGSENPANSIRITDCLSFNNGDTSGSKIGRNVQVGAIKDLKIIGSMLGNIGTDRLNNNYYGIEFVSPTTSLVSLIGTHFRGNQSQAVQIGGSVPTSQICITDCSFDNNASITNAYQKADWVGIQDGSSTKSVFYGDANFGSSSAIDVTTTTVVGATIKATGQLNASVTGSPAGRFQRLGSNGAVADFYRGTTLAGSLNVNTAGIQLESIGGGYTQPPLKFGAYFLWIDTSGRLRIKSGAPTSDTDGTVVGTQT